ncbi:hypothetical protein HHE02_17100 [Helicobacter heilmannii]|uniref:Uncharacterized protein n=1 Tax=Helicobacter heilmannii TaxID=35817 RepID=A0A0K2XV82_HELHE|nr:hypothetical protein BN341_6040 [Helicobacter heilmannii ASB1.4]CRF45845.1 hypothetical protein HHE014_08230 [Helicobacter heilmannii]CCM73425.1 hypothetical protein BN341_6080 [Helicobacter heilmannii ASB1.4]CCM73511.1 hypothetical protein BN341_9280 [Helicobacter heilmannii ASB1.4]CRF48385.1 hypothetical protein HHE02_17100 [Helicobacter heilmannii]
MKDKWIVCANFDVHSTQRGLERLGFCNIVALDFKEICRLQSGM